MSKTPNTTMVAPVAAATKIPEEEVADEDENLDVTKDIIMIRMIT
jgi:hypothetical protein